MTAQEIRTHQNLVGDGIHPELQNEFALIEIAAQLAELNAFLRESRDQLTSNGAIDVTNRER